MIARALSLAASTLAALSLLGCSSSPASATPPQDSHFFSTFAVTALLPSAPHPPASPAGQSELSVGQAAPMLTPPLGAHVQLPRSRAVELDHAVGSPRVDFA